MKILTIIPARKNSKGIKKKNLSKIKGKPLIYYTFKTCEKIRNISKFCLTTDSKEIIDYSKKFKRISAPFIRPKKISKDHSKISQVIIHTLKYYRKIGLIFDYIVLLQPTNPYRSVKEINFVIKDMTSNNFDSGFGVTKSWFHPYEHLYLKKNKIILNKKFDKNRQLYKNFYFISGAIYVCKTNFFIKKKKLIDKKSKAYLL